jgi:hypothetical protein
MNFLFPSAERVDEKGKDRGGAIKDNPLNRKIRKIIERI